MRGGVKKRWCCREGWSVEEKASGLANGRNKLSEVQSVAINSSCVILDASYNLCCLNFSYL